MKTTIKNTMGLMGLMGLMVSTALAQGDVKDKAAINGANVSAANDSIMVLDASEVAAGRAGMKLLKFTEAVNVPGFFSAVPDGTFSIAKTTGLQAALDGKAQADLSNLGGGAATNLEGLGVLTYDSIALYPNTVRQSLNFGGWISVKDPEFGAVGDGINDDTAEIQAALDAMAADATIPGVYLPTGTYRISSELVLKIPGSLTGHRSIELVGDGPQRTTIVQHSAASDGIQFRMNNATGADYAEFVRIYGISVETVGTIGLVNSTGRGIDTHDDRFFDGHFNVGNLLIENCKIGNNGKGFDTGIYFKRCDTSMIRNTRIMYCYQLVEAEAFTKTVTFQGCGFSQAESVIINANQGAKLTLIGCDLGNAPQTYRLANGATVLEIGCNQESTIYSLSALRRYNFATTTYPQTATVSSVNAGTGLFTTSANHGFKPGTWVHFGYSTYGDTTTYPLSGRAESITEQYKILPDGFTGTTFKVAPVPRSATVTTGSSTITLATSAQRTNNIDLNVNDQVRITATTASLEAFAEGNYYILSKPTTTTLTVSLTPGGSAVTFPANGDIHLRPLSPLLMSGHATVSTAAVPSIACELGSTFTSIDSQHTGDGGSSSCTAPLAAVGNGAYFYSPGVWHTAGYSGSNGGRVVIIGSGAQVVGNGIPMTQKNVIDSQASQYNTMRQIHEPFGTGFASGAVAKRGDMLIKVAPPGSVQWDEATILMHNRAGNLVEVPITNQSARLTTLINTATTELKTNTRYRVLWTAATGDFTLNLPDHSSSGEVLSLDDEISIHAYETNGHSVNINLVNATGTITYGEGLVTAAGNAAAGPHGITIEEGGSVTLKVVSVTGTDKGVWQVVSNVGTVTAF